MRFVSVIAVVASVSAVAPSAQDTAAVRRYALLVGVTEFIAPAMKKHNLQGPGNDVSLFRALLTGDVFRVPAANVVSLAGLPADETARPTRANIEREFRRLQEVAGRGDHVLVFLAGHGSQQPADPDQGDEEPDGLDEIFLPADASGWDQSIGHVANAIVDDDLRQWIGIIRKKGAIVTVIVDACHSGTITRGGAAGWRERGIPAETIIPAAALAAARKGGSSSSSTRGRSTAFELANGAGEIAALYASDVAEATPELPMPDRNGPVHGLFTYTLMRVLYEDPEPLSYRELVRRVIDRYRAEGFGPTPSLEGAGADREVLGERGSRTRPLFAVDARNGQDRWLLSAGSVHGLTRGSILEVFSPTRSTVPASIGHVRILDVRPTTATVTPIPFNGMAAPKSAAITAGSYARVKYHEFGALRLRVAARRSTSRSPEQAFEIVPVRRGPPALERALAALPMLSEGLAERVDSSDADWFVQATADRVILIDAFGKRFDVGALDDANLPNLLADRLRRVARAANLTRLSSYVDSEAGLRVQVMRYEKGAATPTPMLDSSSGPIVKAGERVEFVIRNTGTIPLDITVLYIDADFGIMSLYPESDRELDNRLNPGSERTLPLAEVTADPLGWESVIAIGTESTPRHENFNVLAQESIERVRGASASPLRMLLESAVSGTRAARVNADDDRGRFAITQTWLHVEPAEP